MARDQGFRVEGPVRTLKGNALGNISMSTSKALCLLLPARLARLYHSVYYRIQFNPDPLGGQQSMCISSIRQSRYRGEDATYGVLYLEPGVLPAWPPSLTFTCHEKAR